MADIVVTGSLNMDFVVQVTRHPRPGETVLGRDFQTIPGGKGANQACAAARLAAPETVAMIGAVGRDSFGVALIKSLEDAGADTRWIQTLDGATGVALITVADKAENSIVVASGANFALAPDGVRQSSAAFTNSKFALFQLETPLDTVVEAMRLAREAGARIILDPAPAQELPGELLSLVDILTPNETEASALLAVDKIEDPIRAAQDLRGLGVAAVLIKLGDRGCFYSDGSTSLSAPPFPIEAVDTTAAGDCFNGALAVALAEGSSMDQALRFANATAALCCTRFGAQSSLPAREDVEQLLASSGA